MSNVSEEKYNIEQLDDEDVLCDTEQESILNDTDLRRKAHELKYKFNNSAIMDCIGKISSNYVDKYKKRWNTVGTGTVYRTNGKTAYILTCAHNLRLNLYDCSNCHTMSKKEVCWKCGSNNVQLVIVKAGTISFEIRDIETGKHVRQYDCDMDHNILDEIMYLKYPKPAGGFDVAVLQFKDATGYFKHKSKNILVVNGELFFKLKNKNMQYYLFGYPYAVDKCQLEGENTIRREMWGGCSISHEFSCLKNKNDYLYLRQYEIDATMGQSGAAMFCIFKQYALIFAVHTGGNNKRKFNVGTLTHIHVKSKAINVKDLDSLIEFSQYWQDQPFEKTVDTKIQNELTSNLLITFIQNVGNNVLGTINIKSGETASLYSTYVTHMTTLELKNDNLICDNINQLFSDIFEDTLRKEIS
eukprot:461204_1